MWHARKATPDRFLTNLPRSSDCAPFLFQPQTQRPKRRSREPLRVMQNPCVLLANGALSDVLTGFVLARAAADAGEAAGRPGYSAGAQADMEPELEI
jgi:hypothetical protein